MYIYDVFYYHILLWVRLRRFTGLPHVALPSEVLLQGNLTGCRDVAHRASQIRLLFLLPVAAETTDAAAT